MIDLINNNSGNNNPNQYQELTDEQKVIIQDWIIKNFERMDRFNLSNSSYNLKHLFENSPEGFYITNGQFKGAMLAAEYNVKDEKEINWNFNVSKRSIERVKEKIYSN